MPIGVHAGKRGPKPRPPEERARRRQEATQRATKKFRKSNRNQINDHRRELTFRFSRRRVWPVDAADLFRLVPVVHLESPRFKRVTPQGRWVNEGWETAERLEARLKPLLVMRAARMVEA